MLTRWFLPLLFLLACCKGPAKTPPSQEAITASETTKPTTQPVQPTGRLRVTVGVDWEGAYLDPDGLAELAAFQKALPQVPITHWVCPAYLTKPQATHDLQGALEDAVRKHDEVALHLHGWSSLAAAAGVEHKDGPSFFEAGGELIQFEDGDDGFELELAAYDRDEFRKILRSSRKLLESTGVTVLPIFRGGAGIIEGHILEILVAEGFVADASLIPAQFWRTEHEAPEQMVKRVLDVWGPRDDFVAPHWIETPAGKILELPSAPGFGDYSSVEDFLAYADAAVERLKLRPQEDVYLHFGFHQETAAETTEAAPHNFRLRVQKAIEAIQREYGSLLVFERMSDVARRHGAKL